MDILIAMCLILSGIYTTTTIVLLLYCWQLRKNYTDANSNVNNVTAKIADEHNSMAKKILELQDAVNSHEFKLSGTHFNKVK